jgi:hypothetical protein
MLACAPRALQESSSHEIHSSGLDRWEMTVRPLPFVMYTPSSTGWSAGAMFSTTPRGGRVGEAVGHKATAVAAARPRASPSFFIGTSPVGYPAL